MNKLSLKPHQVKAISLDAAEISADTIVRDLESLGVRFDRTAMDGMEQFYASVAGDAAPAPVTVPSAANALQFLQHFFAEPITIVTEARTADDLLGRTIGGNWYDEQVVVPVIERIGQARPYGDTNNVPLASFNNNFEGRGIVRFELGLEANRLEINRAAAMRIDSVSVKRNAVALALAISANDVAFNGFNGGSNYTYGILNDPGLSAYVTVATGDGGSTEWSGKTFEEITADIRIAVQALRVQSGGNFNPERDGFTIGVALAASEALNYTSSFGFSVQDFIKKNYPNARVVVVPQFDGANGGSNVFYVIADRIGTGKAADQVVQTELFLVGTQPTAKGMIEDYSNATAGAVVMQPVGVVRYTGI